MLPLGGIVSAIASIVAFVWTVITALLVLFGISLQRAPGRAALLGERLIKETK